MREASSSGITHLGLAGDRASKVLFAFPLATRKSPSVTRKLFNLVLTFGVSFSIRSDPGPESATKGIDLISLPLVQSSHYLQTSCPRQGTRNCRKTGGVTPRSAGRVMQGVTKDMRQVRTGVANIHMATSHPPLSAQRLHCVSSSRERPPHNSRRPIPTLKALISREG